MKTYIVVGDSDAFTGLMSLLSSSGEVVQVPAREARGVMVRAGQSVQVTDVCGNQVGDLFAYNAEDPGEYHSASHTRAHTDRLFPAIGGSFRTNLRRPILTYVADTSPGIHDMLIAACDPARYAALGVSVHESCEQNLRRVMSEHGHDHLSVVPQPINLFMRMPVSSSGELSWSVAASQPGDSITLRAELDCLVVLSACPQDRNGINGDGPTPLTLTISRGTSEEDMK